MEICREYTGDIAVSSAALLHDVLEDTAVSREALQNFLRSLPGEEQAKHTINLV